MIKRAGQPRRAAAACAAAAAAAALAVIAAPAQAEPATTVGYPAWASATLYTGQAFDTCMAPPLATMRDWLASPYRAIGIYVGGDDRACAQRQLTASWVRSVVDLGWRLIPIYKGPQAPCGGEPADPKIAPDAAAPEGAAAAADAARQLKALGMFKGSAVYYDMEHYATTSTSCRGTVLRFLSAWTARLHQLGYVSGVYANLNLGARQLADAYDSPAYARPDALWIARYDLNSDLAGWAGIPGRLWAAHQRGKQFRAEITASYGGAKLVIDADSWDAPVATLAFTYDATAVLRARTGPGQSYPAIRRYPSGASLSVVCQATGTLTGTTMVWDKLNTGGYVPDYFVGTPSKTSFSAPLTRCLYPYQVRPAAGASERSGPSGSDPVTGTLPGGALAWLSCQQAGEPSGGTAIWDQIDGAHWISATWVATPRRTRYSPPVPRC